MKSEDANKKTLIPKRAESCLVECEDCNKKVPEEELHEVYSGSGTHKVCQKCFDEFYIECYQCGEHWHEDDITWTCGNVENAYCPDCADEHVWYCCDCGEAYDNDGWYEYGNGRLCQSCCESNYFTCGGCGEIFHNDDGFSTEDGTYCENCCPDEERDAWSEKIIGKKAGKFLTIPRCIGVEIEAESGDYSEAESNVPAKCGVTSDGSLDSTGIEIQTPPASLDEAEKIISDTCDALNDAGYEGTQACGLHVHIDADDFRDDTQKLIQLIRVVFSVEDILFSMLPPSRWHNHYCYKLSHDYCFSDFKDGCDKENLDKLWYSSDDICDIKSRKKYKSDSSRYHGFNLHSVFFRGTIEFRYHSGTTNKEKILRWAGILLSIVDYAVNHYQAKEVKKLHAMPITITKLVKFFRLFRIPKDQQKYIKTRIRKFNPRFIWKDNGTKEEDLDYKSAESDIPAWNPESHTSIQA